MNERLAMVVDDLCATFAAERHAIATLDHARIEELAARKHALAGEMVSLCDRSTEARTFIDRVRIEAQANALLAQTAADAIRNMLGYTAGGYDRRAQITTSHSTRVLASL